MNWLRRFMAGRYGSDQFNLFLIAAAFILEILQLFFGGLLGLLAWIPLGWAIFRMFSRNISARRTENMKFLQWTGRIRGWFARLRRRRVEGKEYRFYKCPSCGQQVRVPRNLGRIKITCPKCDTKFEKRT